MELQWSCYGCILPHLKETAFRKYHYFLAYRLGDLYAVCSWNQLEIWKLDSSHQFGIDQHIQAGNSYGDLPSWCRWSEKSSRTWKMSLVTGSMGAKQCPSLGEFMRQRFLFQYGSSYCLGLCLPSWYMLFSIIGTSSVFIFFAACCWWLHWFL